MKKIFLPLLFFVCTLAFSQFGQGVGGGMNGMNNGMRGGMNQMPQTPREAPKKPEIPTDEEILKKMTIVAGLDDLQKLQVREFLLTKPKYVEPKTKEEFEALVLQNQKNEAKLQKIMTPEQFSKWQANKSKPLPEVKPETRKERKERERKEAEYMDNLK